MRYSSPLLSRGPSLVAVILVALPKGKGSRRSSLFFIPFTQRQPLLHSGVPRAARPRALALTTPLPPPPLPPWRR